MKLLQCPYTEQTNIFRLLFSRKPGRKYDMPPAVASCTPSRLFAVPTTFPAQNVHGNRQASENGYRWSREVCLPLTRALVTPCRHRWSMLYMPRTTLLRLELCSMLLPPSSCSPLLVSRCPHVPLADLFSRWSWSWLLARTLNFQATPQSWTDFSSTAYASVYCVCNKYVTWLCLVTPGGA